MVFGKLYCTGLFGLIIAAQAADDRSKPCFGECNWDITSDTTSGTIRIVGPQAAVSDITLAAGWMVIDCNPDTDTQDIRLVCQDPDKGCDHLYRNTAAGTLVRLPEDCGSTPFALVTRDWVHQDQSIPPGEWPKIVYRSEGFRPIVKGMSLTTNWAEGGQNGDVSFFLMGSSLSGAAGAFTVEPPSFTDVAKRTPSCIDTSLDAASNFMVDPTSFTDVTKNSQVLAWIDNSLDKLSQRHVELLGDFNKTSTAAPTPINFGEDFPLFDKKFDCPQNGRVPAFSGEAKVDLDGKVEGAVNYGLAVAGSIIPPNFDEFRLFVGLNATITGTLNLEATLTGSISSGKIPLFKTGIPGLDFPGILSIEPTFSVNADATASVDVNLDMGVDIAYDIEGLQLFSPPGSNSQAGQFIPSDSNVKLSASPNVTSNGQVAAHLIPSLAFGLSAFGGTAKATISLDIDADAALGLSLATTAEVGASANGTEDTGAAFGGCVDITTGLAVNANADADFFSIFNSSTTVPLFQHTFDLFKKCFGDTGACGVYTRGAAREAVLAMHDNGVACPTSPLGTAASVVEQKITGSSLRLSESEQTHIERRRSHRRLAYRRRILT